MRDEISGPVVSFVSLSDSETKNKDKVEHVLTNDCVKLTNEIWIGDSGASSHMATTTDGMFDMKDCRIPVRFGNKSELFATKVEKFRGVAVSKNRKKTPILLYDVKYVPGLHCNLLSLSKAMKVFELSGKDNQLKLKFKNLEYSFDHKIKSGTGFLFGLKVVTGKGNTMVPYRKGHMFLTHAKEVTTKATMKKLKFALGPVLDKPCEYCAVAKLKQKNVCKTVPQLDLKKVEGWFVDISNIR